VWVAKAADALRPGGALAVIATDHVAGGDHGSLAEVQACYQRWDPEISPGFRLPSAAEVPMRADELDRSGRFGPVTFRRHQWELPHSTAAYLELLRTYSGHIAMPPEARDGLFACIADLIDRRHGGRITKRYLTELPVAHAKG
jgi:hypothetical protein